MFQISQRAFIFKPIEVFKNMISFDHQLMVDI